MPPVVDSHALPIALFGGTFDPIHRGHLHLAAEVIAEKIVKKVIFIPAGAPWQKGATLVGSPLERARLVSQSIAGNSHFEISMREIERSGPTYTIDSVREFIAEQPAEEFVLLLGSDAFNGITTWREHEELIRLINMVVAIRPGVELKKVPGAHVRIIESEMFSISSTEIRQAARTGADLSKFVAADIIEDVRRIYGA
ncbi:MAG: nicotinate (nicotinamide) nucleotide adenylyltransferase [Actinobacteria bacterium]|nr:nicotinate (nicotinamide) nucleotide adenylyltransferase [Actinomycetota bacterium]